MPMSVEPGIHHWMPQISIHPNYDGKSDSISSYPSHAISHSKVIPRHFGCIWSICSKRYCIQFSALFSVAAILFSINQELSTGKHVVSYFRSLVWTSQTSMAEFVSPDYKWIVVITTHLCFFSGILQLNTFLVQNVFAHVSDALTHIS